MEELESVLGRISMWHFKRGKRENAFSELDRILNTSTRHTPGFRGYISMLSHDEANRATILTLWQDEESLRESEKGVFANAINKVRDALEGAPRTELF
jgi:quinol monooxygenase YgiN